MLEQAAKLDSRMMTHREMYEATEQFFAEFAQSRVGPEVLARARLILLDTLAVMLCGYRESDVTTAADRLHAQAQGVSLWRAQGGRVEPAQAVLLNTASAAALELCEGHREAMGHIALQVLPALLAAAETHALPGERILPALILGYDIVARMGRASRRNFRTHGHGIWAAAGSAVAVACLRGKRPDQIVECLKIASNLSLAPSFSTHAEGATVRNLTAGFGALIGYQVPDLQECGYRGSESAMAVTLGATLGTAFSPELFTSGMGREFMLMGNYFKFDASGRHMQAPAAALRTLARQHDITPQSVERIRVETYSPAASLDQRTPVNALAAKTSIPYAVAAQLMVGHLGVEAFDAARVSDPAIRALMKRVELAEGRPDPAPSGTAADPAQRWARVIVDLNDGQRLTGYCANPPGEGDQPATTEALRNKFDSLTVPSLGAAQSDRLYRLIETLDEIVDFRAAVGQWFEAKPAPQPGA